MNVFSYVIGLLVLAAVVGAGYLYTANQSGAPAESTQETTEGSASGDSQAGGNTSPSTSTDSPSGSTGSGTMSGGGVSGGAGGSQTAPTPETVTVTYTESGYTPASVDITVGDTVRFVSGGASMWTASAVHPTHDVYPEFDQRQTGTTYEFTFTKTGSWRYHNHVSPNHTGVVNVK